MQVPVANVLIEMGSLLGLATLNQSKIKSFLNAIAIKAKPVKTASKRRCSRLSPPIGLAISGQLRAVLNFRDVPRKLSDGEDIS